MLAPVPVYVPLHCDTCGQAVNVVFRPDVATERVEPPPVWMCPNRQCAAMNDLVGAHEILAVRTRTGIGDSWFAKLQLPH